ncbi:hypothetical protein [Candidatus Ichthyocystis sparus]|uniref:hypothetical protein n=1 Tax=Candidatus Ichthyocystis sparus TaxID=1561004 RepID=UPI00159EBABC|nr:hypothetical protein [Candidatus Ichthyocystis sparus]
MYRRLTVNILFPPSVLVAALSLLRIVLEVLVALLFLLQCINWMISVLTSALLKQ